jgi:hypothetical protein
MKSTIVRTTPKAKITTPSILQILTAFFSLCLLIIFSVGNGRAKTNAPKITSANAVMENPKAFTIGNKNIPIGIANIHMQFITENSFVYLS